MFRPILTLLTMFAAIALNAAEISSPTYSVSKKTDAVVQTALQMWKGDMQQVLGATPRAAKDANIRIVQLNRDASAQKELRKTGVPVDSLMGRNDGFYIKVMQGGKVLVAGNYDAKRWQRDEALYRACARSQAAYQEIRALTDYWNNEMAGGFWKGTMNMMPRDLYMFYPAQLPMALTDKEVEKYNITPTFSQGKVAQDSTFVASDACCYAAAGKGVQAVQMLGHSMNAVQLPKGEALSYDFTTTCEGDATLYVALIPTQPNDTGDLRFSVSIDGGEPQVCSLKEKFRSDQWKLNVLRGQALKSFPVTLAKGSHRLEIKALDDHILIDQWMVDFKKGRKFYVIPVR